MRALLVALLLLAAGGGSAHAACAENGGYPWLPNSCLHAGDLNVAVDAYVGPTPPTNSAGQGALYGFRWFDTSNASLYTMRLCTANPCSPTYNSAQWTTLYNFDPVAAKVDIASLSATGQVVTGGATVTSRSLTTGSITVDCGQSPLQYIANTGAFTITAPINDGSCIVSVENGAGAGAITFSGFSVGTSTGDALDTTNGDKFSIFVWRIHSISGYRVAAMQ